MLKKIFNDIEKGIYSLEDYDEITLITHNDQDGITSNYILNKTLKEKGFKINNNVVPTLNEDILNNIDLDTAVVMCDLGSAYMKVLKNYISDEHPFVILDHHIIDEQNKKLNVYNINPHNYELGSNNASGSIMAYLFYDRFNKIYEDENLKSYNDKFLNIAILGAIGDIQHQFGLNGIIYDYVLRNNAIKTKTTLNSYDKSSPLYLNLIRLSEITSELYDTSYSINFLDKIAISPFTSLIELNNRDTKILINKLYSFYLNKLNGKYKNELKKILVGKLYYSKYFDYDLETLSSLCNSAIKKGKYDLVFDAFESNDFSKIKEEKSSYNKKLIEGFNKIEKIKEDKIYYSFEIDKEYRIFSGIYASMLMTTDKVEWNKPVISICDGDNETKLSIRTGKLYQLVYNKDSRKLLEHFIKNNIKDYKTMNLGGHMAVAGANIYY